VWAPKASGQQGPERHDPTGTSSALVRLDFVQVVFDAPSASRLEPVFDS
jgi:hypothetical protein